MNEEGLELALAEVHDDQPHGECLGDGGMRNGFAVVVEDVGAEEKDGGVDDQRSKVFDYEDGFPCYLRAWRGDVLKQR